MNITEVRVRKTYQNSRLKALVSVTLDGDFAIHDIKVIDGPQRLFVSMPSSRDSGGMFRDIVHPITSKARCILEERVLDAYRAYLAKSPDSAHSSQNAM